MAASSENSTAYTDTTFRAYSTAQAQEYARRRGGYPPKLVEEIISLHTRSGGACGTLLDLGCGPGNSTRDLASHFNHATGIDPSQQMVSSAAAIGGNAKLGPIRFAQGDAETCEGIPDRSVDVVTAATAAHWFDMERFWPTAARVLKLNGTVAFFAIWRTHCDPAVTPHAREIHSILFELEQGPNALGPYQKAGSWSLMRMYPDLQMPWEISSPCPSFPKSHYRRQVWNEEGAASEDGSFVSGGKVMSLEEAEKAIATISAATRWREAHQELSHTDQDCIIAAFARIRELLKPTGTENITMVGPTVLITLKVV